MLIQFVINWDDISSFTAATSLTPITLLKQVNLYDGPYKAEVVGFTLIDNKANGVAADNNYLVNISSSKFSFPGNGIQGLWFNNRQEHVDPHINGDYDFVVNKMTGQLDLTIYAQQFNANRTKNNAATWNDTGFVSMILTLDLCPM